MNGRFRSIQLASPDSSDWKDGTMGNVLQHDVWDDAIGAPVGTGNVIHSFKGADSGESPRLIAVVDDDDGTRRAFQFLLMKAFQDSTVLAYESAGHAIQAFSTNPPAVALLDITMPGFSGFDCARKLRELNLPTKVVFVSGYLSADFVKESLKLGAMGFLVKPPTLAELHGAVKGASSGIIVLSEPVRQALSMSFTSRGEKQIPSSSPNLTQQEIEIVKLISDGLKDRAIAFEMKISESTVKWHVKHLLRKLGASCRAEAVFRFFGGHSGPGQ